MWAAPLCRDDSGGAKLSKSALNRWDGAVEFTREKFDAREDLPTITTDPF